MAGGHANRSSSWCIQLFRNHVQQDTFRCKSKRTLLNARFLLPNANALFTSKKVLNIEFSQSSSCYLLKSNLSIACPISEASTCEAPNFFLNSANLITRTNSTGLKSLQLYKDMCRKMSLGLLKCIV